MINLLEIIMDFAAGDKIDLQGIDARTGGGNSGDQAFSWVTGDFTNVNRNGGLHVQYVTGTDNRSYTVVEASTDNDTAAEFQFSLLGHINLTASDFIL